LLTEADREALLMWNWTWAKNICSTKPQNQTKMWSNYSSLSQIIDSMIAAVEKGLLQG